MVDSNTLLSGFLTASTPPGQIIDAWHAGRFQVVISDAILGEVTRHLVGDRYFRRRLTAEQIARALQLLQDRATTTPLIAQVSGVATHPEDDLILATALSAQADYLVTGDGQLQDLGSYQGVAILSPLAFLDELRQLP